jgi:hypothetical protein
MKSKHVVLSHYEDDDAEEFEIEVAQILLALIQEAGKFVDDPKAMRQHLANLEEEIGDIVSECAEVEEDERDSLFLDLITQHMDT